jgi:hypothetical protein
VKLPGHLRADHYTPHLFQSDLIQMHGGRNQAVAGSEHLLLGAILLNEPGLHQRLAASLVMVVSAILTVR